MKETKKIVYLPLDERPCNYAFPSFLTEDNPDFTLVAPTEEVLGLKKTPAEFAKVQAFLERECKDAYGLIVSVDTLLYGGIVPSRLHNDTVETLEKRLSLLKTLKASNPKLKIFAFALIMRCPSYSSSDEEPDYYETYGRRIFLNGQAVHKYREGVITKAEFDQTQKDNDDEFNACLKDFLSRRERNLSALFSLLSMLGTTVDRMVIPQDDSSPYGYTAIDQKKVRDYIEHNHLATIDIYPGADEVGMTLLSAMVTDCKGNAPKMCPVFPKPECKDVVPLYEDRAVRRSIESQIKNAGAIYVQEEDEADILLFCNLPVGKMLDVALGKDEDGKAHPQYVARDLDAFVAKMSKALASGKQVACADLAYCNGGDLEWLKMVDERIGVFRVSGYAGWNTSSNSLGTVICQAVLCYYYGNTDTHKAFLAERVYEDVGYCGFVRRAVCNEVLPTMEGGLNYFHVDGKKGEVSKIVKARLEAFVETHFPSVFERFAIATCEMPWSRMFEVGLTVEKRQ